MNEAKQFRCHDYVFELCGDTEQVDELEELFVDLATPTVPDAHIWTIEVEKGRARVVIDGDDVKPWVGRDEFPAHVNVDLPDPEGAPSRIDRPS